MNPCFNFLKMTNTEKYLYRTTLSCNLRYFTVVLPEAFRYMCSLLNSFPSWRSHGGSGRPEPYPRTFLQDQICNSFKIRGGGEGKFSHKTILILDAPLVRDKQRPLRRRHEIPAQYSGF